MKTVVITGISKGIGKALAKKFLAENFFVIGTSKDGSVDFNDPNLITLQLDLESDKSVADCVKNIENLKKPIDILINNAAVIVEKPGVREINVEALKKTLAVNLVGTINFTESLVPSLAENSHIINISSRQGSMSYPLGSSTPSYKISKAALNMFTRVLSLQLGDKAIVSSVHPGAVKSGLAGPDANMEPEEAALYIYNLAISKPETGQFWFKEEKFPW